jgi:hypothetical protein
LESLLQSKITSEVETHCDSDGTAIQQRIPCTCIISVGQSSASSPDLVAMTCYHLFPDLKQHVGCFRFKRDGVAETAVKQQLKELDIDICCQEDKMLNSWHD